jgi:hypothetical protein
MKLKLHVLLSVVGIFLLSLSAFAFSIQNKTVAAGKPLTLAGSVFFDANNNGVRDAKENELVTRAGNEPFTVEIYNASGDYLEAIANADNEWVVQSTSDFPIVAGENYVLFVYSFNNASVNGFPILYPTTQNVGSDDSVDSDFTSGYHCGSNEGKKYKGKLSFNPETIEDVLNLNLGLIDGAKVVNEDQCTSSSSSSTSTSTSSVTSSSSSLAMCTENQLVYNNTTPLCSCDLQGGMYQLSESQQGVICIKKLSSSSSVSSSLVACNENQLVYSSTGVVLCNCYLEGGTNVLVTTSNGFVCRKPVSSSSSSAVVVSSSASVVGVSSSSVSSSSISSSSSIESAISSTSVSSTILSSSSQSNNSGVLSFVSSSPAPSSQVSNTASSNRTGVLSFVSSATNNTGVLSSTGINLVLLIIGAIAIVLCGMAIMFITRKN